MSEGGGGAVCFVFFVFVFRTILMAQFNMFWVNMWVVGRGREGGHATKSCLVGREREDSLTWVDLPTWVVRRFLFFGRFALEEGEGRGGCPERKNGFRVTHVRKCGGFWKKKKRVPKKKKKEWLDIWNMIYPVPSSLFFLFLSLTEAFFEAVTPTAKEGKEKERKVV